METIETTRNLEAAKKGCVLTIGNFDGVHLGHQEILTVAKQTATQKATQLIVMTFEPHPLAVLNPQKSPGILTPLTMKKHLLAEFGVDYLLILESNPELLSLSPADFVERFLVKNIQPDVVVEGESFNFGSDRTGSVHTLKKLGVEKGFEVVEVEAKEVKLSTGQTVKISSTLIRDMLANGKVADTTVTLGRPYRLIGKVIPGCGKGKQLGFPTANIEPAPQLITAEGVYAGFAEIGDSEEEICAAKEKKPAALSIGRAETFSHDYPLSVEAHMLIDDVGDLHGKWLAMDFIKRLRGQRKFETESQLSAQIAKDCKKTKQILENIIE
ncbi:MAG: bifunctional riboflavin kinase/FAD synthetase [Planctomycetota bacterium]|jgi:riboflavin kinase/FMN adenylyltransferase